jgi:hypothetical protein
MKSYTLRPDTFALNCNVTLSGTATRRSGTRWSSARCGDRWRGWRGGKEGKEGKEAGMEREVGREGAKEEREEEGGEEGGEGGY